jgi:hypothetical protein
LANAPDGGERELEAGGHGRRRRRYSGSDGQRAELKLDPVPAGRLANEPADRVRGRGKTRAERRREEGADEVRSQEPADQHDRRHVSASLGLSQVGIDRV